MARRQAVKKEEPAQPASEQLQTEGSAAEQPLAEPTAPDAAQARQYPPEPNPRSWAKNNVAGVQLRERREPYQSEIIFNEKPTQDVIELMKSQKFRWNGSEGLWSRPVGFTTQAQDRLTASRTYSKAVDLLLQSKGVEAEPEIPF